MIKGQEFHSIISSIFDGDVRNLHDSEQVQVCCPRCQEREGLYEPDGRYNLEINTARRIFRCWKCDFPPFSGSLGRLIRMYGTQTDYDLYKSYAGQFFDYSDGEDTKVFEPVKLPEEFIPFTKFNPDNPEHFKAYNYMVVERKLDFSMLKRFGIGFCTEGYYANRIVMPSYDRFGDLNYFVTRSYNGTKPPYLNPKADKDIIVFNEGRINWDSTVYIVEGVFEWLTFPVNTIPVLGKRISPALFQILKHKKPEVVIIFDPDAYANSVEMFQKLSILYGRDSNRLKIVKLKGKYDLDEIRMNYGNDAVVKKIRTARQLEVDDYFVKRKYFSNERQYNSKSYSGNTKW